MVCLVTGHHELCTFVQLSEVEKGRAIYAGIQKFVAFIMSVHIAEAREVATAVWEEFEASDVTVFTQVMQIFICIVVGIPVP